MEIIWNNLFLILLFIIYVILKRSFPEYLTEKSKNLATKQDIGEITQKIKTVESQMNILTGNILDYSTLKRQYIIDYFAAYNNWERTITSSNLDSSDNCKSINTDSIKKIQEAKHQYNLKEGEIELFIEDTDFYTLRKNLTIRTLEFQQEFELFARQVGYIIEDKDENYRYKIKELTDKYNEYIVTELKKIYSDRTKLLNKLSDYIKEMTTKN